MIEWKNYPDVNRMWETRGARFCAHERLTKANVWTNYAIATGSVYVIILSLLTMVQISSKFSVETIQFLSIASVVFSVVIIFMSLIEGGKNYVHRAEAMHACAREISVVYHKAEAKLSRADAANVVDLSAEVAEYDRILDKYPLNHDTLDFDVFRSGRKYIYPEITRSARFMISVRRAASIYGAFWIMFVGVPIIVITLGGILDTIGRAGGGPAVPALP